MHANRVLTGLIRQAALGRGGSALIEGEPGIGKSALAALTDAFDGTEEVDEIEDLLADAVRLAIRADDLGTAQALAGQAAALAAGSDIPHRQASALYCRSLLDRDAAGLLAAAQRYDDAGRPLLKAMALEAAAGHLIQADDRDQARDAFIGAVEVHSTLGAAVDVARLQDIFRAYGIWSRPYAKQTRRVIGIKAQPTPGS